MPDQSLEILIKIAGQLAGAQEAVQELTAVKGAAGEAGKSLEGAASASEKAGSGLASLVSRYASLAAVVALAGRAGKEFTEEENTAARLKGFGLGGDETIETIKKLAFLTGGDLVSASELYIHAANGQTRALKGLGIAIEENATKTERLAELKIQIASRADELSKANAETLTGAYRNQNKAVNDLLQNIGGLIVRTGILQGAMATMTSVAAGANQLLGGTEGKARNMAEGFTAAEIASGKLFRNGTTGIGGLNKALDDALKKIEEVRTAIEGLMDADLAWRLAQIDYEESLGGDSDEAELKRKKVRAITEADKADLGLESAQNAFATADQSATEAGSVADWMDENLKKRSAQIAAEKAERNQLALKILSGGLNPEERDRLDNLNQREGAWRTAEEDMVKQREAAQAARESSDAFNMEREKRRIALEQATKRTETVALQRRTIENEENQLSSRKGIAAADAAREPMETTFVPERRRPRFYPPVPAGPLSAAAGVGQFMYQQQDAAKALGRVGEIIQGFDVVPGLDKVGQEMQAFRNAVMANIEDWLRGWRNDRTRLETMRKQPQ